MLIIITNNEEQAKKKANEYIVRQIMKGKLPINAINDEKEMKKAIKRFEEPCIHAIDDKLFISGLISDLKKYTDTLSNEQELHEIIDSINSFLSFITPVTIIKTVEKHKSADYKNLVKNLFFEYMLHIDKETNKYDIRNNSWIRYPYHILNAINSIYTKNE